MKPRSKSWPIEGGPKDDPAPVWWHETDLKDLLWYVSRQIDRLDDVIVYGEDPRKYK